MELCCCVRVLFQGLGKTLETLSLLSYLKYVEPPHAASDV